MESPSTIRNSNRRKEEEASRLRDEKIVFVKKVVIRFILIARQL